ncbi:hypothetical protein NDU88_001209 [Pleurodeles waltl]|uniref:Uncharacterized protein n=1 Tax=Pleurodeles waltl TaxID=8319 RepID=A0AAV7L921_PLEWA|nr:hypothetical protein NDU88_001209 [Pleurodeles waltl]
METSEQRTTESQKKESAGSRAIRHSGYYNIRLPLHSMVSLGFCTLLGIKIMHMLKHRALRSPPRFVTSYLQ